MWFTVLSARVQLERSEEVSLLEPDDNLIKNEPKTVLSIITGVYYYYLLPFEECAACDREGGGGGHE